MSKELLEQVNELYIDKLGTLIQKSKYDDLMAASLELKNRLIAGKVKLAEILQFEKYLQGLK